MTTMTYRLGDTGTLGYLPDQNADGTPFLLQGYGLRLRIATGSGYVTLPGRRETGQTVMVGGVEMTADVAAFEVSPALIDLPPRLYRIAVEYDDSTEDGWREFAESEDHYLNVEKF